MAGMFDDLVPGTAPGSAPPTAGGMFDDLVPASSQNSALGNIGAAVGAGWNSNSPVADVLRAPLVGAAKGMFGLAGLPAVGADLIGAPADKAVRAGGGTPTSLSDIAGPQALQGYFEKNVGPLPEAKTVPGQYAQTIGEFLPGLIGGPEGLAGRFATRVVAPAMASETAGQLTGGTPLEPYARIGGALLGGAVGGMREAAAARGTVPVPASTEELFNNASANYRNPAIAAMRASPQYGDSFANIITNDLRTQHFDPLDPGVNQVYNLVDALRTPRMGPQTTITELDTVRQRLRDVAKQGGPGQAAAQVAIKGIDNAIDALPTSGYVTAGNAQNAVDALKAARGEYATAKSAQLIDAMVNQAENSGAATHSGGNLQNLIYQQVRNNLNAQERAAAKSRPGPLSGLTDQETQALRNVLPAGTGPAQVARVAGNLLGGGGGLGGMLTFLAGEHLLGPAGMALPFVGAALKQLGARNAVNRLNAVRDLIATRAPSYGAANASAYQQALANSGILGPLAQRGLAQSGLLSLANNPQPVQR